MMNARAIQSMRPSGWLLLILSLLSIAIAGCPPTSPPGIPSGTNPPQASAGANQTVNAGATVTLDGSGSTDPDGDVLSFSWRQTLGTPVTLSNASAPIATFTAPSTGTTLLFELTVSDELNNAVATTGVSVQAVDPSARVIELRERSILDDPAFTGRFPDGWTFPALPPGLPVKEGKGAPGWISHLQGGPAVEVELAPGANHRIELPLTGVSILMGSAVWSGTTQLLNVTLSLDGTQLTVGQGYSMGLDRGGSVLTFVTATGGQAALTLTNTSSATVKVRMAIGALAL